MGVGVVCCRGVLGISRGSGFQVSSPFFKGFMGRPRAGRAAPRVAGPQGFQVTPGGGAASGLWVVGCGLLVFMGRWQGTSCWLWDFLPGWIRAEILSFLWPDMGSRISGQNRKPNLFAREIVGMRDMRSTHGGDRQGFQVTPGGGAASGA
jgi:hypothetical protein